MTKTNPFADYIRQYCRQNNLCLRGFAELAGIPHSTLHELMRQNSDPKVSYFIRLGQTMRVHPMVLLGLKWQHLHFQGSAESHRQGDKSAFINETIPDGSIIPVGAFFTKTWTIQNIGCEIWQGRRLVCVEAPLKTPHPAGIDETLFSLTPHAKTIDIDTTYPQQNVAISIDFVAPKVAGRYVSYWKMVDKEGEICFPDSHGLSVNVMTVTPRFAHQHLNPLDNTPPRTI